MGESLLNWHLSLIEQSTGNERAAQQRNEPDKVRADALGPLQVIPVFYGPYSSRGMTPHTAQKRQLLSWELDDGEAIHAEAPTTFWIPPQDLREILQPGTTVKLIFRLRLRDAKDGANHEEVERMWVLIREATRGSYEGILDNDPYCTDGLKAGDPVAFEPRHVIQVYQDDTGPQE